MSTTRARAVSASADVDPEIVAQKVVDKLLSSDVFMGKLTTVFRTIVLTEMGNVLQEYQQKVGQLEDQLRRTQADNSRLLDDLEQHSRLNNIIIYGLPDDVKDENTEQKVTEMIEDKLGIKVGPHEIDVAHRLGGVQGKGKPIIVKFVRRLFKKTVLASRTKLKGTRIVIKEDLTKKRLNLLKLAGEKYGPRKVWSVEGRIYARIDDRTTRITSAKDLGGDGDVSNKLQQ